MKTLKELSPVEILACARALAKIENDSAAREEVSPVKDSRVRVNVSFDVLLTVAEDTTAVVAAAVPVWKLLAAAFGRLSPETVSAIVRDVDTIVNDGDEKSFKKQVTESFAALKAATVATRKGAVKVAIVG